ncbi:DJ-1/PfpI family protein [Roseomonas chloroacetimidivorans]|uniref:DJ-1/PfpI family protein n=1 Tax=Roseomonas chloroacetimidivorans TaxID=1766656 RepID=UPI003C78F984
MQVPVNKIAVLVGDGYQEMGFWYPLLRFREEGVSVTVIAEAADQEYRGDLGYPVIADIAMSDARVSDYDAVILPGGAENDLTLGFVSEAQRAGLVIGASATAAKALSIAGTGRTAMDAVAEPVVTDGRLVTARSADDLPGYFLALTSALATARA